MPTFQKSCDVNQGYNFKKDIQTSVGYLTSLKVGDVTLKADQTVKDPLAPETDFPVVAVLSGAMWELGVTDTLYYTGQISVYNKQQTQLLVYKDLSKVDVVFKFAVYSYDPIEKKYFKCMLGTDGRAAPRHDERGVETREIGEVQGVGVEPRRAARKSRERGYGRRHPSRAVRVHATMDVCRDVRRRETRKASQHAERLSGCVVSNQREAESGR